MKRPRKLIIGNPYLFEWNDTYSRGGWFDDTEVAKETLDDIFHSVGFLVRETKIWYVVATHKTPYPHRFKLWGDLDWIPKGSVSRIKPCSC